MKKLGQIEKVQIKQNVRIFGGKRLWQIEERGDHHHPSSVVAFAFEGDSLIHSAEPKSKKYSSKNQYHPPPGFPDLWTNKNGYMSLIQNFKRGQK